MNGATDAKLYPGTTNASFQSDPLPPPNPDKPEEKAEQVFSDKKKNTFDTPNHQHDTNIRRTFSSLSHILPKHLFEDRCSCPALPSTPSADDIPPPPLQVQNKIK
jgi:hypothetical protein